MKLHKQVLRELVDKYKKSDEVRGILVFGSVADGTETQNSDIDLWIYKNSGGFIHYYDTLRGVKVDLFEISLSMLRKLIVSREAPVINSLIDGKFLYINDMETEEYISLAKNIKNQAFIPIETMPKSRIINVLIQLSNLIEDAKDLIEDNIGFRLIFSEVIVGIYNNLYDFFGIWRGSPKKTLRIFEKELPDIYPLIIKILDDNIPPSERVKCAENILNKMAVKYGGIPTSHIITKLSE